MSFDRRDNASQTPAAAIRRAARCGTLALCALAFLGAGAGGCEREDMHNQPRAEIGEESDFFADGKVNRPLVEGVVARGELRTDLHKFAGRINGELADTFPFPITKADIERGRERFNVYCYMCHGATGDGNGMIVRRGFTRPPSFHDDRLRTVPVGHFFEVITNGYGAMYSYNDRVHVEDRWRIAAYIRTLQFSQHAEVASLAPADREQVERAVDAPGAAPLGTGGPGRAGLPHAVESGTGKPDGGTGHEVHDRQPDTGPTDDRGGARQSNPGTNNPQGGQGATQGGAESGGKN